MELLELMKSLLVQYQGTHVERLILALLMPIQENTDIAKRIGERVNAETGYGIALDVLGDNLRYPRPIVPDIEGEYFGFKLKAGEAQDSRQTFDQAPFWDSQGSIYQRTEAGDRIYRAALLAIALQNREHVSYGMIERWCESLGNGLALYTEGLLTDYFGDERDLQTGLNGDCTWHDGNVYFVGQPVNGEYRLQKGAQIFAFQFQIETKGAAASRPALPGAVAGLSSHDGELYCILRAAAGGGYIYRINDRSFNATLENSNVAGLPALIDCAVILDVDTWVACAGSSAYTCTWGSAQAVSHTDALPAGKAMTSLALIDGVVWGTDADGVLYRRDATARTFSAVSSEVWKNPNSNTPLHMLSSGHTILLEGNGHYSVFPVKRAAGYRRAVSYWLWSDDRGIRNILLATESRIKPSMPGVAIDYDFYYPR